jgi:hypothetical protein
MKRYKEAKPPIMNKSQAFKKDIAGDGVYVDQEGTTFGVYGVESNFCYIQGVSKQQAEKVAHNINSGNMPK